MVGRFSENFSEMRGLTSRGFKLQVEWMTKYCARNYEKNWLSMVPQLSKFLKYNLNLNKEI